MGTRPPDPPDPPDRPTRPARPSRPARPTRPARPARPAGALRYNRDVDAPDLDGWLPDPALRVHHARPSQASADELWHAAQEVRLSDTALLGRLVRWRIPGLPADLRFDELFRQPPFMVLEESSHGLVSGLVGRIWTLRRDYPRLSSAEEFRGWERRGDARVVIANWVGQGDGTRTLHAEARVAALGYQGRVGVAGIRPMVRTFGHLVGSDGVSAAVRRADHRGSPTPGG